MNTFDIAFVIAAGGFALIVWVLLFADTLHPFLDRMGRRLLGARPRRFARGGEVQPGFHDGESIRLTNEPVRPHLWMYECPRRRCPFVITGDFLTQPHADAYLESIRDHVATHRTYPRTDRS